MPTENNTITPEEGAANTAAILAILERMPNAKRKEAMTMLRRIAGKESGVTS